MTLVLMKLKGLVTRQCHLFLNYHYKYVFCSFQSPYSPFTLYQGTEVTFSIIGRSILQIGSSQSLPQSDRLPNELLLSQDDWHFKPSINWPHTVLSLNTLFNMHRASVIPSCLLSNTPLNFMPLGHLSTPLCIQCPPWLLLAKSYSSLKFRVFCEAVWIQPLIDIWSSPTLYSYSTVLFNLYLISI